MWEKIRASLVALRNVIIGGNLVSLALIFHPGLLVMTASTTLFYFRTLTGKRGLEQRNPDEVITKRTRHDIRIDTGGYFWGCDPSYAKDIVFLSILTMLLDAREIFEIGTLDGYTALHFAMNSSAQSHVYSLDLPLSQQVKPRLRTTYVDNKQQAAHRMTKTYRFSGTAEERKITCLFGDSATFNFESFYGKVDLFFIDGAHSYEYVKSDTEHALRCVKQGGCVVWHDYGRAGVNGVSKWLNELSNSKRIYSIPGSSLAYMIAE